MVEFPGTEGALSFKVRYGANSFLSVQQGQWMAYDHGEGFVTFSANGYSVKHRASDMAKAKRVRAVYTSFALPHQRRRARQSTFSGGWVLVLHSWAFLVRSS